MKLSSPRILFPLLVAAGLLAGFAIAALFVPHADHGAVVAEGGARGPAEGASGSALYTCSMHPQVRSTDPDEPCPICGMDLIPVPADDGPGDTGGALPQLSVSPRAAALMQVEVQRVERRAVRVPVPMFGMLQQDETRLRTISAWIPGRIDWLHVDFTGLEVRAGQPMARVFSPKLIAAQEELLHALRAEREIAAEGIGVVLEATRLTVEAARDRLRLLGLDAGQVAALERRGSVDDHVTLPAPVSGVVLERMVAVGDYVQTGEPIYRLADLSRLWAQLEVYESDLHWLRIGQEARFTTQAHPGEEFTGKVTFIDPVLDPRKRTARVRVEVENPDGRLKPGMFVRGVVAAGGEIPEAAASLVIPASAPLLTGRRAVVYVQQPDAERPTFEARDVQLGPRAGDWHLVEAGLAEGELVVSHGAFKIDAELQIRGRPSMMQPAGGRPPTHDHGAIAMPAAGPDPSGAHDHGQQHEAPGEQPLMAAPGAIRDALGGVVTAQFTLVAALADDDPAAARDAARTVQAALDQVDGAAFAGDAARARWEALGGTMRSGLAEVAGNDGLAAQRRGFETFSDALTTAVQAFGIRGTGAVYRAVCPMVQGRDGYWLQPQEQIANPYYGEAMLRCGWIAETLAEPAAEDERP